MERLTRYVGFIDLGILAVVLVMIVLPPREMYAAAAQKGSEQDRFTLALAEARTVVDPKDTVAVSDYTRRLATVGFRDWAVEQTERTQVQTRNLKTHWRTLLATSVAYIDRFDVKTAVDYANRAVAFCDDVAKECPGWDVTRMKMYRAYLESAAKSGINPWRDPIGFQKAGEKGLLNARLIPSSQK
jgi:hypothetical protein